MKINLDKIRLKRISLGFSQESVAESLGISQAQYSRLERGSIDFTINKLGKLIALLKINPMEILIFSNEIKDLIKDEKK